MNMRIDAEQIEYTLSYLANLRQRRSHADMETLETLRPAWIGLDAWDMLLDDVRSQRYRDPARRTHLRLVVG